MIEQRVTLRYGAQQIPAIVQAVQGDTGRDVIFELADYEIPAGATANYYIDKPDDTAIYNSAEVISSTEILAHLTEQALAVPGRNNGQVRILNDGEVITSFDFVLEVEAFRGLMRMQSETEVNIFDEALQAAAEDAIEEIRAQTPVVTGMQDSIAPAYSASSTYAVGDYVMYNAQLYRCITEITTAEAWTAAHWANVPLAKDVSNLKTAFNQNVNDVYNRYKKIISYDFQYIDNGNLTSGYLWNLSNGVVSLVENSNYSAGVAYNVPAGTYYLLAYSPAFSYVENLITGEIKSFSEIGVSGAGANAHITADYPHNIYICSSNYIMNLVWKTSADIHNTYGAYNIVYETDTTLSEPNQIADAKEVGVALKSCVKWDDYFNPVERNRKALSERWQFISPNESDWHDGTYNNTGEIDANAGFKCICVKGLPAGTYWINHFASYQTFLENIKTGEFTSFYAHGGYSSNTPTDFTVAYDFNIYISIRIANNIQITTQALYNFNPNTLPLGFTDWNNVVIGYGAFDKVHVFHVGSGKEYTTLKAGIEAAEKYMDSVLYVDAGEYDLITEYGSTYFENFTGSGSYLDGAWGIVLKNRIHIIFAENAKVICHYEGDNIKVGTYFSAFNSGRYGFTLENTNIDTSGIRYSVHDDRGNADEEGYCNKYLRCRIKHNKIGTQVTGMEAAIGGGLGNNGDILIEGCYFEAVGWHQPVSYHNSAHGGDNYRAHVVVRGNYLVGGFRFNDTGVSEEVSDVYDYDNSVTQATAHGKTTQDAADNIVVRSWNNYIRS